jgi:hypothetical protein
MVSPLAFEDEMRLGLDRPKGGVSRDQAFQLGFKSSLHNFLLNFYLCTFQNNKIST